MYVALAAVKGPMPGRIFYASPLMAGSIVTNRRGNCRNHVRIYLNAKKGGKGRWLRCTYVRWKYCSLEKLFAEKMHCVGAWLFVLSDCIHHD